MPKLTIFKSRACDYVTNDVVFELATTCSSLEHVNIARCNCVQDDTITLLAQNNSSTLSSLDIAWSKASDVSIKIVFDKCKKLFILNMEGCKSSDVAHIEALIVNAKALKHVSMAWVNSCDEKWAHKVVQLKPDLCIVDYYGEEIRGKEYLFHKQRHGTAAAENSMATAASVKNEGCKVLVARESSEGLSACSIDYDTDYNDYSEYS